jgi:hypothetical protein
MESSNVYLFSGKAIRKYPRGLGVYSLLHDDIVKIIMAATIRIRVLDLYTFKKNDAEARKGIFIKLYVRKRFVKAFIVCSKPSSGRMKMREFNTFRSLALPCRPSRNHHLRMGL